MYRRRAERAKAADALPPDVPPPNIQPIRSPFEDQLPAVQRAEAAEALPLRKAAGAEGLDFLAAAFEAYGVEGAPQPKPLSLLDIIGEEE
jgi:hypothetical protein